MMSYIRPPIFPIPVQVAIPGFSIPLFKIFGILLIAIIIGWMLERSMKKRWKRKTELLYIFLPMLAAAVLYAVMGFSIMALKGFIFFLLLLYASENDRRIREVDDYIHIMIALTALIGTELKDLPIMFIAAVIITIPQLVVAVLNHNTYDGNPSYEGTPSYGGGDIKLMAASTFLLGLQKGFAAIIIGLLSAIIITTIKRTKKQNKTEPFALVPFLSAGCFFAFLI